MGSFGSLKKIPDEHRVLASLCAGIFLYAKNTIQNNINCGGPSGPAPSGVRMADAVMADAVLQSSPETRRFSCDYCDNSFLTKIGLGQHMRHSHPVQHQARSMAGAPRNRRWNDDERRTLAILELNVVNEGYTGSLDKCLSNLFTGRTVDAIKGQRRQTAYRSIMEEVRANNSSELDIASDVLNHGASSESQPTISHSPPSDRSTEYLDHTETGASSRRLWSDEERRRIAISEIEARNMGLTGPLDRYLAELFTGRTANAIRSQRTSSAYRRILVEVQANSSDDVTVLDGLNPIVSGDTQPVEIVSSGIEDRPRPTGGDNGRFGNALRGEIRRAIIKLHKKKSRGARRLAGAAKTYLQTAVPQRRMRRIMEWLSATLTTNSTRRMGPSAGNQSNNANRVQRRERDYAVLQNLFRRSTTRAFEHVMGTAYDMGEGPATNSMFEFWENIFETEHTSDHAIDDEVISSEMADSIWAPVTTTEIKGSELAYKSAPGPDGLTVAEWRSLSRLERSTFYNVLLVQAMEGYLDPKILTARTIFIPKVDNPSSPEEFRPIGITSVIVRQLHRILAQRLQAFHECDDRQRAFRRADGTAENLLLLKAIMDDAQLERSEVHIVSIDIRKAFDSVPHDAIIETITNLGCPRPFIKYMDWVYDHATTTLEYKGQTKTVKISRGVIQGDPLSPIVFNYLMDRALTSLDDNIGYSLKGKRINCMAFADDVILISGSKAGMQYNLSKFVESLGQIGLDVNIQKSHALSLMPLGKQKKVCVPVEPTFTVNGTHLKQLGIQDSWKYLGVRFEGFQVSEFESDLIGGLEKIGSAPLKPQQRYLLLRTHLIPMYQHTMVLGKLNKSTLNHLDTRIRKAVRSWFKLPHDSPTAYFHAKVNVGGLSIPSLLLDVPRIRLARMERFMEKGCPIAQAVAKTAYYRRTKAKDEKHLVIVAGGVEKDQIIKYWETKLDEGIDTRGLVQSKHCPLANSFIWSGAQSLSGRDYIHFHHVRVGCLPSRARRARGRELEHNCRAGCGTSETNYHVLQQCSYTQGGRILRHDNVVRLLASELSKRGDLEVHIEPHIDTSVGMRKPDLIITNGSSATVIDVHIIGEQDMAKSRRDKINKYRDIVGFNHLIRAKYNCSENTRFEAVTMSYRGLFEKASAAFLHELLVTKYAMRRMSTSVLFGSWLNWFSFNRQYWSGRN